ncbi:MAG: hypothetical protein ABW202_09925, partial [Duganella sp.]
MSQHNAQAQTISFAGFAFAGDYATIGERFSNAAKVDQALKSQPDGMSLSRLAIERAYAAPHPALDYAARDALTNLKSVDQALMAVLLLNGETVSTEHIGNYYKTFVSLRADVLIFDYKSKTVVRSYPISVVMFDATAQPPTSVMIEGYVKDLLLREDGGGLLTQFTRRLSAATLPKPGTRTIQVKRAELTPEAMAVMPAGIRDNPALAGQMISDAFGSILAAKAGVSLLPTGMGHAMGAMSFRLDNGDALDLKIGEGDYLFEVKLNKFARIKSGENNVGASYVYGVYGHLRFYEPALNTEFLNTDLKNGEVKIVPANQVDLDDFPAYEAAIRGLFLKFSDALVQPESKWLL